MLLRHVFVYIIVLRLPFLYVFPLPLASFVLISLIKVLNFLLLVIVLGNVVRRLVPAPVGGYRIQVVVDG